MMKEHLIEKKGIYYKDLFPLTVIFVIFIFSLLAAYLNIFVSYAMIVGVSLIIFFLYKMFKIKQVIKWKSVIATIKSYKIMQYDRHDKSESNISTPDYEVNVVYVYEYDDNSYESENISYDRDLHPIN